jgi:CheY-like chemotaxis protein
VVRSHGGFVSVSSEVGRGSTFRIHLPLPPDVVQVAPATDDDSAPPAGRGELILVVDDEAVIRDVTQKTLEAAGYQVVTAEDGAQAISRYAQHRDRVALVLTDMMMPVMDGPALARALRRLDPGVRIVTASGLAPASRTAAGETDLAHSLAKPYSANVLLKTVRAVLDAGSGPS